MKIIRFKIGPFFRFNNGDSRPILGTNRLSVCDKNWNIIAAADLGDDQWKIDKEEKGKDK